MNVAGYPVEMTTAQSAHKIGSSFADLTQTGLTTAQIDTCSPGEITLRPSRRDPFPPISSTRRRR